MTAGTYGRDFWERMGWTVEEIPGSTQYVLTTRGACAHVERIATGSDVCDVTQDGGTDYDLAVECFVRVLAGHTAPRWALFLRDLATPTAELPAKGGARG